MNTSQHRVVMVPNGCHEDWIGEPVEIPARGQVLRLLFSGRLTEQKRPDKVLEIARCLKEKGVCFALTILGDGALYGKLQQMTREMLLTEHVQFAGHVSRDDMRAYYGCHHMLLAPSEAEGMSISILEALFCGLYVLSTPVSGNNELIKNGFNGEILPGEPEAFACAVIRAQTTLASPKERREHHRKFVDTHNWKAIVRQYEHNMSCYGSGETLCI